MTRSSNSDAAFKKKEAVIDRPGTTADINDQYYKDPPRNLDRSMNEHKVDYPAGVKLVNDSDEILESGQQADELGRGKKVNALSDLARDDAVHS